MTPLAPILFAVAQSFAQESAARPDWLKGDSPSYPRSQYMIGVGEGPSREKAADRARAELAKSFGLSVEAKTSASASESSDGKSSSFSQQVSDDVRTSTAKVLHGVEIAQTWQGPESHFALAVLDRAHSLKILRDKIEEIDREFGALSDILKKTEGKFAKLRTSLRLVQLAKDRRRLNADYRLLNPDGKGVPAPTAYEGVVSAARKAVSALNIQVAASGDHAEQLAGRVMDGLGAYGIRASAKSESPCDLVVEAKAEAKNLPAENLLWYWARGTVTASVSYGSTGEPVTRIQETLQEAARDPGSAREKAYLALADRTADRVFKLVSSPELVDD